MQILISAGKKITHFKKEGDPGRVASTLCCSSQCILGSVDSNSVEKKLQCPHVVAEWAVKLRWWALWLAGSSLPYINKNQTQKQTNNNKTVTKYSHKSEQTVQMTERLHKSCTSYIFKSSV